MKSTPKNSLENMSKETINSASSSNELVEVKPIPNTPFAAVKVDTGWFLCIGKYRLSEILDSEEAVIEDAKDTSWDRLMQVILAVNQLNFKISDANEKTYDVK